MKAPHRGGAGVAEEEVGRSSDGKGAWRAACGPSWCGCEKTRKRHQLRSSKSCVVTIAGWGRRPARRSCGGVAHQPERFAERHELQGWPRTQPPRVAA